MGKPGNSKAIGVSVNNRGGAQRISRLIDNTAFKNEGFGQWELDIEGVGGGSILRETGGSLDDTYGLGGELYSAVGWDSNYNRIGERMMFGSLNAAKSAIREMIRQSQNK